MYSGSPSTVVGSANSSPARWMVPGCSASRARTQTEPGGRRLRTKLSNMGRLVCLCTTLLLFLGGHYVCSEASASRQFTSHVLALRSAVIAAEPSAKDYFDTSVLDEPYDSPMLWRGFFENTIVKLGRLRSSEPIALYYNPLLDVALITRWGLTQGRFRVTSVEVLPGEMLGLPLTSNEPGSALLPAWTNAKNGLAALPRIASTRTDAFRKLHPVQALGAGASTPRDTTVHRDVTLTRILWNAAMMSQWNSATHPWLPATLTEIDRVLASRNAVTISRAAPDTDSATVKALSGLPIVFFEGLIVDMILDTGAERVILSSLPEDGDVFLVAICKGSAHTACALRRFVLISLLG